jgi:LDH2 family malate/lactate/ureidoglycolate dehydrogenase
VSKFCEPDKYYSEIERTIADIEGLPTQPGFDRVTLPGAIEWERANKWRTDGIPLHNDHLRELSEVAAKMRVAVPW